MFRNRYLCPCCAMPTLTSRGEFDICPICLWEDDGQGTADENIIHGGPNGGYSLHEARRNFKKTGCFYRHPVMKNQAQRNALFSACKKAMMSSNAADWQEVLRIESSLRGNDGEQPKPEPTSPKKQQFCPICQVEVKLIPRYPKYICVGCERKASDKSGRRVYFVNTSIGGGCQGFYADNNSLYDSNECYVDDIRCLVGEARFGGIVMQVSMEQKPL